MRMENPTEMFCMAPTALKGSPVHDIFWTSPEVQPKVGVSKISPRELNAACIRSFVWLLGSPRTTISSCQLLSHAEVLLLKGQPA